MYKYLCIYTQSFIIHLVAVKILSVGGKRRCSIHRVMTSQVVLNGVAAGRIHYKCFGYMEDVDTVRGRRNIEKHCMHLFCCAELTITLLVISQVCIFVVVYFSKLKNKTK